jgi:hypothetical protein
MTLGSAFVFLMKSLRRAERTRQRVFNPPPPQRCHLPSPVQPHELLRTQGRGLSERHET